MPGSWGHDPGALGILAESLGSEDEAQMALDEVAEDGWALLHRAASPSVRLARWEDGHPERRSMTTLYRDGGWGAELYDEHDRRWRADGATRDEARAAALDQAEGVRDDG